ncbi:hypothetical protein SAMN05216598_4645 [Pseudomonas asplenii]|uniref:Uncharacterized protein n=1 Tax=Pseudomonas asplenii TaxID=53407 RepID=A0A1H1YUV6_9PSED|nr:hypothetical protein SAMN05216598_4645 [Pseudomonas asplenii]
MQESRGQESGDSFIFLNYRTEKNLPRFQSSQHPQLQKPAQSL